MPKGNTDLPAAVGTPSEESKKEKRLNQHNQPQLQLQLKLQYRKQRQNLQRTISNT